MTDDPRAGLNYAAREVFDHALHYMPDADPVVLAAAVSWINAPEVSRYYGPASIIANALKYAAPVIAAVAVRERDEARAERDRLMAIRNQFGEPVDLAAERDQLRNLLAHVEARGLLRRDSILGEAVNAALAVPAPTPEAVCSVCDAPKGLHAVGQSCNTNCGGTVVALAVPAPPTTTETNDE